MRQELNRLSAVQVRQAPAGKYADGGGLWLVKTGRDTGKWVLRVVVHGRRREMGLGAIRDVSLKKAREEAAKWRAVVRAGEDPIKMRDRQRQEKERKLHLLADVARDAFEARKASLKEDGRAGRWFTPLELHVLPKLGKIPIAEIDQIDIREALAPIWHAKAETARKAMNRLNIVLQHAAALGLDADLQAVSKAKALLGKTRHKPKNIPAMPWQEVPEFYASLEGGGLTEIALQLLILTGVRSRPLRFLRTEHIDGDVWTIPAELVKSTVDSAVEFRVPLSRASLEVLERARPLSRNGWLFPNVTGKGVISDMTLSRYMERRGLEYRPHGFRSSLRDWLAECTDAPFEIAETILGHKVGGAVERAYRRTDYLEQRRMLMERWAEFVAGNVR